MGLQQCQCPALIALRCARAGARCVGDNRWNGAAVTSCGVDIAYCSCTLVAPYLVAVQLCTHGPGPGPGPGPVGTAHLSSRKPI